MGLFDFLLGKKSLCDQCDRKVAAKKMHFRRGLHFCSPSCVTDFVNTNPPHVAAGGTPDSYRHSAVSELDLALSALSRIGMIQRPSGSALQASAAVERLLSESSLGITEFYDAIRAALPYLYALGETDAAEWLETTDLDVVLNLTTVTSGRLHSAETQKLLNDTGSRLGELIRSQKQIGQWTAPV